MKHSGNPRRAKNEPTYGKYNPLPLKRAAFANDLLSPIRSKWQATEPSAEYNFPMTESCRQSRLEVPREHSHEPVGTSCSSPYCHALKLRHTRPEPFCQYIFFSETAFALASYVSGAPDAYAEGARNAIIISAARKHWRVL